MNGFDDWALTLAVFLPLAGALVMMVIPRSDETSLKGVALLTALGTMLWLLRRGI